MSVQHHAPTSRSRASRNERESAGQELQLGEFQDIETLSHSEVQLVLTALMKKRKQQGVSNESAIMARTQKYLDSFARLKSEDQIRAVEKLLNNCKVLAKFERAQLGNLCCETADEAKMLIPSLNDKISDDDLQALLDEITQIRTYDKLN